MSLSIVTAHKLHTAVLSPLGENGAGFSDHGGGLLSLEEACDRYKLTVDEFLSWKRSIDRHGLPGLRATRIQDYRS